MNVYLLNQTGKTIFVRILAKPSEKPGIVNEMVFELHAKKPLKIKEVIAIWRIAHGNSDWLPINRKDVCVSLVNKLGWKINEEKSANDKDMVFKLKPLN